MNAQQRKKLKALQETIAGNEVKVAEEEKRFDAAQTDAEKRDAGKMLAIFQDRLKASDAAAQQYLQKMQKSNNEKTATKGQAKPAAGKITITAKKDGFRRCGMAHPAEPTTHPIETFTAKELTILEAETMLVVVRG